MSETTTSTTATAPPRTAAERALIETFERIAPELPGGGWVSRVRGEAMSWLAANGLPTRRVEAFKYTDLRDRLRAFPEPASLPAPASRPADAAIDAALGPLSHLDGPRVVLVDGIFSPELSRTEAFGDAAEQMPLAPLLRKAPSWLEGKFVTERLGETNALSAINTAFMADGLLLKIKPGKRADRPVLLVSVRTGAVPAAIALRNVVAMEAGSAMTLVEAFVSLPGASSSALTSVLTDVTLADGASLCHMKCALDPATHLASWVARIGANAAYDAFQLTAGPALARNDIDVVLAGSQSRLDLSGAFLARGSDHLDTTLVVDHQVPHCTSREIFKGVLADRSRGVFQGRIIVRPGADKTDGKQMARALLLSEDAEFDSKPELEIYADDVACGHGATAAALDDDLMFYCRSRGIPEATARSLLIEAFIGEAVDRIADEAVRAAVMELARTRLAEGAPA